MCRPRVCESALRHEQAHIDLSGLGGIGDPDPESGAVEFRVVGDGIEPPKEDGIF